MAWQAVPTAPRRRRKRKRRGRIVWLALGIAFLGWVLVTRTGMDIAALADFFRTHEHLAADIQIVAAVVLIVAGVQLTGVDRYLWHMAANATAFGKARALGKVWVVDGDTLDGDGVRYRLANIDAPETGDNAKCFREDERGREAKKAAIELVRGAKTVSVRRTWRIDRYRRRIAFVLVDGQDLGQLLIARGLARPWRGKRESWCGANGSLAKIARRGARPHDCSTCRAWR